MKKFRQIQDLVIINTCCVTREAEIKSLKKYRAALRNYSTSRIIATGCACRLTPEKYKEADKIINNVERNQLIKGIFPSPDRARYFLKVCDGCNGSCTFCIVSKIRDKIESKTGLEITREIQWAKDQGYREIVLVGANIGLYGQDIGTSLLELFGKLSRVENLPRIRLSSIEPKFISHELLRYLQDLPFCRHFHIPIQSADDYILSQMGRGYTSNELEKMINMITKSFSGVAIGADVIVGFPGETNDNFLNTFSFIKNHPFTNLHVFTYSPRPCTKAYSMGDPVVPETKRFRSQQLRDLIEEKNLSFRKNFLDHVLSVISEGDKGSGMSDNYIRVSFDEKVASRRMSNAKIDKITRDSTHGIIVT